MRKQMNTAMSDLAKAMKVADKDWQTCQKLYWKFIDKLVECRENQLFFKQKSDMWYLGYLLSVQTKEYKIKDILAEIEEGIEEGREQYGE